MDAQPSGTSGPTAVPVSLQSLAGERAPDALVAEFLAAGRTIQLKRGQELLPAGGTDRDVYMLVEGRLKVELLSPDGRALFIREVVPVRLVGELAAIDDHPRSASLIALAPSRLIGLPSDQFQRLVFCNPENAAWIQRHLTALVRSLTAQVYALSFLPVRARLHCELHRLARDAEAEDGTATLLEAPTHEELGQRIGSHREAVSREMAALARLGLLCQHRRRLVIQDAAALAAMANAALGDGAERPGLES